MLKIMESPSSVISHDNYVALVHTLLAKTSESQTDSNLFWSLVALTTDVLLLYKFGECETYLLDSFLATKDVCSLYVLARVFYDYASDLVERHQVLKSAINDSNVMHSPAFWGLLATISLSKAGKKAIEGIGSIEQLAYDLMDGDVSGQNDTYLFKLSLFSRLAAMKPIQSSEEDNPIRALRSRLSELFSNVRQWLSQ